MPTDHMTGAADDPFTSASAVRAKADGDPERITGGRYRLPDLTRSTLDGALVTGSGSRVGGWQRVTTLVKAIGEARALDLWHQRMMVMGFVKRPDLFDLACATVATTPDAEMKGALEGIAAKVLSAAGADEGANLGTAFHGFTEAQDLGMMHYARRKWHGKLSNYAGGLLVQGLEVVPEYVERRVVVLRYGLAGTLDRILRNVVTGEHVISDLKSQKAFWTWLEIAAQEAAYAMADAMWDRGRRRYVEMPAVSQAEGVVAWMPVAHPAGLNGQGAPGGEDSVDFFRVDLEKGRAALDLCWQVDRMRSEAKSTAQTWGTLRPAPGLSLVEAYARRLEEVGSPQEGSALWAEVSKAGLADTPELQELAREIAQRFLPESVAILTDAH